MTIAWTLRRSRSFRESCGRAVLLAAVALMSLDCASLGLTPADPMRDELERLEAEQHRMAKEERMTAEAAAAERALHPGTLEEKLRRGDQHLAAGRLGAALWDYVSAHRLDPEASAPRVRLGYVHLRSDPERAQPLFESALEREPDYVSAHVGLGLSLLASGQRDAALQHLERAVELAPNSAPARAALGVSLDQIGRHADALAQLEQARDLRPHDSRILNNLGVAYLRAGSPERAEALLRAALREDRRDEALRSNNLGMALALQGRFAEALESFRRAGDEQSARSNLGYAHYARGEYDAAITEYERALLTGGAANVQVVRNLAAARHAQKLGLAPAEPKRLDPQVAVERAPGPDDTDVAREGRSQATSESEDPWLWEMPPSAVPN